MKKLKSENRAKNLTLITGGAKSGKSKLAETLASSSELEVIYVATMRRNVGDLELCRRIARHESRRPATWKTLELSKNLAKAIIELPKENTCVIIDCLSLYVSAILFDAVSTGKEPYEAEDLIAEEISNLCEALRQRIDLKFLAVSNEVGWSVVPENPLSRAFRDFLGNANQSLAEEAGEVFLCCAGQAIKIK